MTKYAPLKWYLNKVDGATWQASFAEIETILGFPLPPSARLYREWWANTANKHTYATSWLDAGWRTAAVNFDRQDVMFHRAGGPQPVAVKRERKTASVRHDSCTSAHAWDEGQEMECRLGMQWKPLGRVMLDDQQRLQFPRILAVPGLYRLRIRLGSREALYIGETDNLSRRFGNYRNPGPRQKTCLRTHAKLKEALAGEAEIAVSVVMAEAWIDYGVTRIPANFASKVVRCLFENAALSSDISTETEVLNRAHTASENP